MLSFQWTNLRRRKSLTFILSLWKGRGEIVLWRTLNTHVCSGIRQPRRSSAKAGVGCKSDYDYDYDHEHEHEQRAGMLGSGFVILLSFNASPARTIRASSFSVAYHFSPITNHSRIARCR